jgi:hypothetical protein
LHGLNQGRVLLKDLCNNLSASLIFIQEHWQTPANLNNVLCFSSNYTGYGISAMESTVGKSILRGRPFGGVATLVHNKLAPLVSCIACCERYVILTINNYLFINMYLPCSSVTGNSIIELLLTEVLNIVKLFPDHTIIVGGDMNISLLDDSIGARIIHKFRNECKLTLCNDVIKLNSEFVLSRYSETL